MSNVEDAKQLAVRNLESWKPYPWWFHGCQHHRHREPFAHDFDEVEVGPVEGLIYHGIPFRNFSPRSQNVCIPFHSDEGKPKSLGLATEKDHCGRLLVSDIFRHLRV